jgi:hypothetical protein
MGVETSAQVGTNWALVHCAQARAVIGMLTVADYRAGGVAARARMPRQRGDLDMDDTNFLAGSNNLVGVSGQICYGVATVLSVATYKHDRRWPHLRRRGRHSRNPQRAPVHRQATTSTTTPTA